MGEERGRLRYGFLKDSGRLEREHFEGERIAAAWDRTREGGNRTGTAGEQRGTKRDTETQMK